MHENSRKGRDFDGKLDFEPTPVRNLDRFGGKNSRISVVILCRIEGLYMGGFSWERQETWIDSVGLD